MLEPGRAHALGNYTKPGRRLASPSELRGVFGDDALERVVAFPSGLMHDALVETYEGGEGGRRTTVYVGCGLASRPSDEGGRGTEVWKDTHAVQKNARRTAPATRDARDPARVALVIEPTPRNYRMFVAAPMACAKPDLVAAIAGGRASQRLNATCLQKRRHDWTYEVCPQHYVRRFRDDSSVDLGHYTDSDVNEAGVVAQSYDHGAPCLGGVYTTTTPTSARATRGCAKRSRSRRSSRRRPASSKLLYILRRCATRRPMIMSETTRWIIWTASRILVMSMPGISRLFREARGLGRRRLRHRVEGRPEGGGEQQVHSEFGAAEVRVYQGFWERASTWPTFHICQKRTGTSWD